MPWQRTVGEDEYVISSEEKTSVQARCGCHPTLAPGQARAMRVNRDYQRGGALAYLAAYDVHHAQVFGRCEPKTSIVPRAYQSSSPTRRPTRQVPARGDGDGAGLGWAPESPCAGRLSARTAGKKCKGVHLEAPPIPVRRPVCRRRPLPSVPRCRSAGHAHPMISFVIPARHASWPIRRATPAGRSTSSRGRTGRAHPPVPDRLPGIGPDCLTSFRFHRFVELA